MADPTKGDAPVLGTNLPTVEVEGRTYTLRRLGVTDTFALARIIAMGAAGTRTKLSNDEMLNPSKIGELMLAGFMTAEAEATKLLASVIGVTVKEFTDPELFPMGAELQIVAALAEHPGLRAFFAAAVEMARRLPRTPTASPAPST
jgi:hypothetical protein